MKFPTLILADLHANKRNLEEIKFLFKTSLPHLYTKYKCKSIMLAGDVFHNSSSINTEVYITFYNLLEELYENITKNIYILTGNHDKYLVEDTLLPPIKPLSKYATIYNKYTVEKDIEYVPYGSLTKATTPGVTFLHGFLQPIVDVLKIPYATNVNQVYNDERVYICGHVHDAVDIGSKYISVGCPIPNRFVEEEFVNCVGILDEKYKYTSIGLHIAVNNIIEVNSVDDLKKESVKEGKVSTRVKLKLYTPNITLAQIREFKKDTNWIVTTTNEYTATALNSKLTTTLQSKPLEVYKEFFDKSPVEHFSSKHLLSATQKILGDIV